MPSGPKKRKQARRAKRDGSPSVESPVDSQVVTELDTERGDDSQDDQDDESMTPRTPARPNELVERDTEVSQTEECVKVLDFDVGTAAPVTEEPTTECDAAAEEERKCFSGSGSPSDRETVLQGKVTEAIGDEAISDKDSYGEDEEGVGFQSSDAVEEAPNEREEKLEGSVVPIIIEWDMEMDEDDFVDDVEQHPTVGEPGNESEVKLRHQEPSEDNPASEADNPPEPSIVDAANYPETDGSGEAAQPAVESTFIKASDPVLDDRTELAQPPATFERDEDPEKCEGVEEDNQTQVNLLSAIFVAASGPDDKPATEPGLVNIGSGAANSSEEPECQIVDSEAGTVDTIDWPMEDECPFSGDEMGTDNVPLEHDISLNEQQWRKNTSPEVVLEEFVPSIAYEYPVAESEKTDDTFYRSVEGPMDDNDVDAPIKCSGIKEEPAALGFNDVDMGNDSKTALTMDDVQQSTPLFEAHTTAVEIEGGPQYTGPLKENPCDRSELAPVYDSVRHPEKKDTNKGPVQDAKQSPFFEGKERAYPDAIQAKLVEDVSDAKPIEDARLHHKPCNNTKKEAKEDIQMKPDYVEKQVLDATSHDEVEANSTPPNEETVEFSLMPTVLSKDATISYPDEEHQGISAASGVSNVLSVGKEELNGRYLQHQDGPTSWKGCCGMFDWLVGTRN